MYTIPDYEHPEWRPCPKRSMTLNGQTVNAYDITKRPTWWIKKWEKGVATVNGAPVNARLTHGAGRGGTVDRHYLHFLFDGVQYFIYTGERWPVSGLIDIRA